MPRIKIKKPKPTPPPTVFYDPARDGVTFSLLSTYRDCREKARLHLQGWTPKGSSMSVVFGGVVHEILHRIYDDIREKKITDIPTQAEISSYIEQVAYVWATENPKADADTLAEMELTLLLVESTLPLYFNYWFKDFDEIVWEAMETEFLIPFRVVSHVTKEVMHTRLRGKLDGTYRLQKKPALLRVLETKTKGHIDAGTIADILPYELQVNIYLTSVSMRTGKRPGGVLYNVIRRPQLRQKQSETLPQFADRIRHDIQARPDFYFIRMEMRIDQKDLARFDDELKDLVAEFLDWWGGRLGHYKNSGHCENKYGKCPMLPICARGDYSHHYRRDRVFRELEEF